MPRMNLRDLDSRRGCMGLLSDMRNGDRGDDQKLGWEMGAGLSKGWVLGMRGVRLTYSFAWLLECVELSF
jgi:hypothetical protein